MLKQGNGSRDHIIQSHAILQLSTLSIAIGDTDIIYGAELWPNVPVRTLYRPF